MMENLLGKKERRELNWVGSAKECRFWRRCKNGVVGKLRSNIFLNNLFLQFFKRNLVSGIFKIFENVKSLC